MWMHLFVTLLLFPVQLHPPLGWTLLLLREGKRRRALCLAAFGGLFYDLSINHLPLGLLSLLWVLSALLIEGVRSRLFLGRPIEMFFLTLLMALSIEAGQAFLLRRPEASFGALLFTDRALFGALKEALFALLYFELAPSLKRRIRRELSRRGRPAKSLSS